MRTFARRWGMSYFLAFLRAAQYFFMRALTALRCAADILLRVRRGAGSMVSATPRAALLSARRPAVESCCK